MIAVHPRRTRVQDSRRAGRAGFSRQAAMLLLASASAFSAGHAWAQDVAAPNATAANDSMTDIVVTAQKRSERLQDVPIAITALSAEAISNAGATDFSGIVKMSPTLNSVPHPTSSDTLVLTMRGQGEADADKMTKDGSVGVYIDGIPRVRAQGSLFDLADVEQVEVLRGPQGTLYGRNSTGGAVNIISKKPTGELGGKVDISYGNRGYVRFLGILDLPAWNGLSAKASFLVSDKDGYVKNIGGASNNYGALSNLAGRVALHWNGGGTFSADYQFDRGRTLSTPPYYVNPSLVGVVPGYTADPYRTYRPVDLPESRFDYANHGLTLAWEATDLITLKSLTGHQKLWGHRINNFTVALGLPVFPFSLVSDRPLFRDRTITQEFQVIGQSADDRLKYTLGLFYLDEKGKTETVQTLTQPFGLGTQVSGYYLEAASRSKAAYAQVTWTPPVAQDRLELTAGGRYTSDRKSASRTLTAAGAATGPAVSNRQTFSRFNPAFTANMKWTPELSTYAKVSTGYKAGGSSEAGADFRVTYGPQDVVNYEIGLKSQWFDRRIIFNVAAYYDKIKGLQVDIPVSTLSPSLVETQNIGRATIKGLEVELTARPMRDVSLTAAYALVDSDVDKLLVPVGSVYDPAVNPASPFVVGQNIANRFLIPFSSRNTVTIAGDATFLRMGNSEFSAHIDYRYQSGFYGAAGAGRAVPGRQFFRAPSAETVNARITWLQELSTGTQMRFSVWGQNIFDTRNKQFVIGQGDLINGYVSGAAPYAEPASYGVQVALKF